MDFALENHENKTLADKRLFTVYVCYFCHAGFAFDS